MATVTIDFDDSETYHIGTPICLGPAFGYIRAALEGYRIDSDGFVVLGFDGGVSRRIPVRRLLRITED